MAGHSSRNYCASAWRSDCTHIHERTPNDRLSNRRSSSRLSIHVSYRLQRCLLNGDEYTDSVVAMLPLPHSVDMSLAANNSSQLSLVFPRFYSE
jgi:hypothetical protein